jgi:hypothetical protein
MRRAQISAVFAGEILRRIWDKWGPLSASELIQFFSAASHVPPDLAAALARDLLRVFNPDYEAAAFCIAPRLEALVRTIVVQMGLPIYRVQRQRNPVDIRASECCYLLSVSAALMNHGHTSRTGS